MGDFLGPLALLLALIALYFAVMNSLELAALRRVLTGEDDISDTSEASELAPTRSDNLVRGMRTLDD